MTTTPAASPRQDDSPLGAGVALIAVVAAIIVCRMTGEQDVGKTVAPLVATLALGTPSAVLMRITSLRRDPNLDIARIERGELRRPVALVVMLLSAAILFLDTAIGAMEGAIRGIAQQLILAGTVDGNTAFSVDRTVVIIFSMVLGMCLFLVASHASHYFAKRPYLWTATAIGVALAIRELVLFVFRSGFGGVYTTLAALEVPTYLGFFAIAMVAVWFGGRYHDAFLAKKLTRIEGKVARQRHSAPQDDEALTHDSIAAQEPATKVATLFGSVDQLSVSDNHRTSDPVKQIERLWNLRDTGALTQEEFQAKKAELLCRI
jgi:hypothetical protein